MATRRITAYASGSTLYDLFRDEYGQVLNNTTLALEAWGASAHARVDYSFSLDDLEGDLYGADYSANFPIGIELYRSTYLQAGADPADGDTLLYGPTRIEWTGEAVLIDGEEQSITNLCNYALSKVGGAWKQNKLASYFEETDSADLCQRLWPVVRKEVLCMGSARGFNWQEAIYYAELGDELEDDNIPDMAEWEYAFTLPSDCLRVIAQIDESDYKTEYAFEVMRGMLLTNCYSNSDADSAYIKYIYDNTDITTYSPPLYNAMATLLAAEYAGAMVGADRRTALRKEFEGLIMALAAGQNQSQVYHDDKGYENAADRRHRAYGKEN